MTVPVFTEIERQVVRIGLSPGEPAVVIEHQSADCLDRARRLLFGHSPAIALADRRLEVLRAMAAAVRTCPDQPDDEIVIAFLAAGWQHHHIAVIRQWT